MRLLIIIIGLVVLLGAAYYFYQAHTESTASADGAGAKSDGTAKDGGAKDGGGKGGGKKGGRAGAGGPTPVSAITVTKETLDIRLTALGTVTPRNNVTVRTRVDGPLLRVLFKEGQIVKTGDLLAEIDPLPLQAALTQMAGNLARDQALLQNAQIDLERYQGLMATDSIPKQQLDTQAATVRQYQGIVATDRGAVEAARLQLSYTRIFAPLTGKVGLRLVDPGNMVHASDSNGLVSITQLDPITVVAAIPEIAVQQLLQRINQGSDVPVEAWDSAMKGMLASGKLLSTDNQIDTATGTLKLKAEFGNASGVLFPNQFVNVRVLVGQDVDATVIHQSAVQRGAQQGTYVYLVNPDSTVSVRQIKLGTVDGDRMAVTAGLNVGDRVVSDGADKLREGAKVEVIEHSAAATPDAAPAGGDAKGSHKGRRGKGGDGSKGGKGSDAGNAGAGSGNTAPAGGAASGANSNNNNGGNSGATTTGSGA
ncbi:MAG TPA: MdtA/MuxA family multidrug efflux RND transporter periplasmic adaptor subunit [Burkholderiales bacterium]|nr:MdtA/MuxA family multidrug efflux RND transporter periplasmic adaptor subunit [Burkholderiales bacterium]